METVSCHYAKTHHKNKCLREAIVYYHWQHWRATADTHPSGDIQNTLAGIVPMGSVPRQQVYFGTYTMHLWLLLPTGNNKMHLSSIQTISCH